MFSVFAVRNEILTDINAKASTSLLGQRSDIYSAFPDYFTPESGGHGTERRNEGALKTKEMYTKVGITG